MANKKQILLITFALIGLIGWLGFIANEMNTEADFEVEHLLLSTGEERKVVATLYVPDDAGQFPDVLFGAGSGTDPAMYTNWGKSFVKEDIAILIVGPTYRKFEGGVPEWEIINDKDILLKEQVDQFSTILEYMKERPQIDPEKIVIGGHSGGANTAYHLAYENKDLDGVFAIAGRHPPENPGIFPTNLLLATGAKDTIVPPGKLKEVGFQLTGKDLEENVLYGNFEDNTAKKLVISENSGHLLETFDENIMQQCINFTLASLQKEPINTQINVITIDSVLSKLVAGLLFLVSFIFLTSDHIKSGDYSKRIQNCLPAIHFLIFYLILSTTISEYLRFLGPVPYRFEQYIIMAFITIIAGAGLIKINEKFNLNSRVSLILDVALIGVSISLFTLVYTQLAQFQIVTQVAIGLMVSFLVSIPILAMSYNEIPFKSRLTFTILSLIWLVPAITPVY